MSTEPKNKDPYEGLLFRWRAPEGVTGRLIMWGFSSALVLTVIPLMFEVVYPVSTHRSRTTQRVILLDPTSPKSREVIAAVTDRNFLLMAPTANAAPRLSDLRPVFAPGFKDFRLDVKDLPETGAASSNLPRLFGPDRPPLPPVAASKPVARPATTRALRLVAVPSEGLESRPILHDIEPLPEGSPALGEINARFRVGVGPDGRIVTAASLMDESAETGAAASRTFRQALNQMRFAPVVQAGPQWGILTFSWKGTDS